MTRANFSGTVCGILLSAAMLFATTACTSHTQPGARHAQPGYAQPGYAQPGQAQPGQTQSGYTQPGQTQPGHAQPDSVSARPGTNADMERKAANFRKSREDMTMKRVEMDASMKERMKEMEAIGKKLEMREEL